MNTYIDENNIDENNYKLDLNLLNKINSTNNLQYFGNWTSNISELSSKFCNAQPFNYIKIDNFLESNLAEECFKNFPNNFDNWHKYWNPIEVKYANDNINTFPECLKNLFYILSTNQITSLFSNMSGINNLEYDPYLHGAGLHAHPRYGRLNMHLDYEKHPKLKNKERRLNVILFLTKDWRKEWNGDNQLWDKEMKQCKVNAISKRNPKIRSN